MKLLLWVFFLFTLLFMTPFSLFAQENLVMTISPSPTPITEVVYDMPYPGLLPDHPLYLLKTARDQVIGFLITDPVKKASFDLLQSDKRFQGGVFLYQKDASKKSLAFSTISKGHNYLDDALHKIELAKEQGMDSGDIGSKILLSTRKQEEILKELKLLHPEDAILISQSLDRALSIQKKADALKLKNESK